MQDRCRAGGGDTLTEHMEHDWSRCSSPSRELDLAVVQPSVGTGHMGEGKGGHRLCM
jgi:hypothetical protein